MQKICLLLGVISFVVLAPSAVAAEELTVGYSDSSACGCSTCGPAASGCSECGDSACGCQSDCGCGVLGCHRGCGVLGCHRGCGVLGRHCGCREGCGGLCGCCGARMCGCKRRLQDYAQFNCNCRGSYKFPVPPLYTYHWPGMYSQRTMTEYISPWRFPPLQPLQREAQPATPEPGPLDPLTNDGRSAPVRQASDLRFMPMGIDR